MTEEARAARNKYHREYTANRTEAQKERQREYHAKWRKANLEHLKEYHAKWRKANKDKIKAASDRYWEKKAKEGACCGA